jgi:hypothetical protein
VAVKGNVALVDETLPKLEARLDERKDELLSVRRATFPNRRVQPTTDARFRRTNCQSKEGGVGGWTLRAVAELYKQARPER